MKFGKLTEDDVRNIFLQKLSRKSDLFLFFKQVFYEVQASNQHLSFNIYW